MTSSSCRRSCTPLLACYERRGETARARGFLQEMIEHYPGVSPVLALAQLIERDEGIASAQAFLARQVQQRPSVRGEAALIDLSIENPGDDPGERCRPQADHRPVGRAHHSYRCQRCGFGARAPSLAMPELQALGQHQAVAQRSG